MRSNITLYTFVALLPSAAWAAKYSLHLFKEGKENQRTVNPLDPRRAEEGSQALLNHIHGHNSKEESSWNLQGVPIIGTHGNPYFYTTNLSLGTPPQPFRALVDINWSEPFVSSTACDNQHCKGFLQHYNSSSSSTYAENGTMITIIYPSVEGFGFISSDTLTLGAKITVPHLDFIELKDFNLPSPATEVRSFDAMLGLAIEGEWPPLSSKQRKNRVYGQFRQMVEKGVLDKNMFSILWPTDLSRTGDIMFGGYNDALFEGPLVSHPLFPKDTTDWKIRVDSLYIKRNDRSSAIERIDTLDFAPALNWTALFSSRTPYIGLPSAIAQSFHNRIDWQRSECTGTLVVDCDRLSELPDLIVSFGGQNVSIKGRDYVERIMPTDTPCQYPLEECVVMIGGLPSFIGGVTPYLMLFGMSFLKKVYGVFDWDEKTVSFGKLWE